MPDLCYSCNKHLVAAHNPEEPPCSNCLPSTLTKLRRCSKCALATYCGSECQKAHWKTHKSECAILASERDTAKSVGLGDRYESLERWRRHRANGLRGPAVWALDAGLESDKSATHVLLVKLTIREDSKSRRNPWRLESARVVPDQLLKQTYGYDIEPQPDTVRILFIDQELSRHFSLHWEIKVNPEAEGRLRKMIWSDAECDWVDWAANLVQYGTNRPDRPPEIDSYLFLKRSTRQETLKNFVYVHMWADRVWDELLVAADSALELHAHPERLEHHRLVVFVSVSPGANSDMPRVQIRHAEAMSIGDIKRELYCLEAGDFVEAAMHKHLFSKDSTRVLLVADDLPFPFKMTSVPVVDQEARTNARDNTLLSRPYDQNWLGTLRSEVGKVQE